MLVFGGVYVWMLFFPAILWKAKSVYKQKRHYAEKVRPLSFCNRRGQRVFLEVKEGNRSKGVDIQSRHSAKDKASQG